MKRAAIGIDIGGTKTLFVLTDKDCRPLHRIKFKTTTDEGEKQFTRDLLNASRELLELARNKKLEVCAIGIGCAGMVDPKKLRIVSSPNIMSLEGYAIGRQLRKVFDCPVRLENDVRMGIYGEFKLGAARGAQTALGIFFGTGVGGAAIINKQLHYGVSGLGGQVGGLLAQPVGGPEAAWSHGIVDRIGSKAAIAGEALIMAEKQWAPYLHKKAGTDLANIGWGTIKEAIEHGDDRVAEMLKARMRVVGIALSNVVNFLNPDVVVLGGGLFDEMPEITLPEVERGLREYLPPEVNKPLKVRLTKLGGKAIALGAAHLALSEASE